MQLKSHTYNYYDVQCPQTKILSCTSEAAVSIIHFIRKKNPIQHSVCLMATTEMTRLKFTTAILNLFITDDQQDDDNVKGNTTTTASSSSSSSIITSKQY